MKRIFLCLAGIIGCTMALAQTSADYDAALAAFKEYYNRGEYNNIYSLLGPHAQSIMSADKTVQTFTMLKGQLGEIHKTAFLTRKDAFMIYRVDFDKMSMQAVMQLDSNKKLNAFQFLPYTVSDTSKSNFNLHTPTGTIYGTLTMPDEKGKVPVVLIIAGSGPTDRDGNNNISLKTNAYLMLADSLQKAGIACLRYDKRGIAKSEGALKDEHALSFEDYINDAVGYINMLKQDGRFSKVIVMGHSEGSLIGMVAAQRTPVDAYISVAGAGEDLGKIIVKQKSEQSKEAGEATQKIIDSLRKGFDVKNISAEMASLFRPSIQPYWRSVLKYVPTTEIKKLKIPITLVQGTTDMQVGVEQVKMLSNADPAATLKIIPGMNHVLKQAPADKGKNALTYENPNLPLDAQLTQAVIAACRN